MSVSTRYVHMILETELPSLFILIILFSFAQSLNGDM